MKLQLWENDDAGNADEFVAEIHVDWADFLNASRDPSAAAALLLDLADQVQ